MAYSSRRTGRKTYGRTAGRASARPRARAGRSTRRTASRSGGGAAARTVRIVVETAPANPIQRPALGVVAAKTPRKPQFV